MFDSLPNRAERSAIPRVSGLGRDAWAVVVTTPGAVTARGLAMLSQALAVSPREIGQAVWRAPAVLATATEHSAASAIVAQLGRLGISAEVRGISDLPAMPADTFEVAIHVVAPERIAHGVATVAEILGASPEVAYAMLSIPPGRLMGGVGAAGVASLRERFGPGIVVTACPTLGMIFDLHRAPGVICEAIANLCGDRHGLVETGLDSEAAAALHRRMRPGAAHLVPRGLIRHDVVIDVDAPPVPSVASFLEAAFDLDADDLAGLAGAGPIALVEAASPAEAAELVERAAAVGFELKALPVGFDRCDVLVTAIHDRTALRDALHEARLPMPNRLPAAIASDLRDLDARLLAFRAANAGADVAFRSVA